MLNFKSDQIFNSEEPQKITEQLHPYVRQGIVTYKRKKEEIEQNIKAIQPKILSKDLLVFPPGHQDLKEPYQHRQSQQPIEIIGPPGISDLFCQVIVIPRKRVLKNAEIPVQPVIILGSQKYIFHPLHAVTRVTQF